VEEQARPSNVSYRFTVPVAPLQPRVWDFVKGILLAGTVGSMALSFLAFGTMASYARGQLTELEAAQALVEPSVWALFITVAFELLWVAWVVMRRGSGDFTLDLGLSFHQSDVLLGIGAWLADGAGAALIYGVIVPLVTEEGLGPEPFDRLQRYVDIPLSLRIVMLVTIGLMVPFAEEMLFRGILLRGIQRWAGPIVAIIASAAVFGVLHAGTWTARDLAFVIWTTWAGLIFGILRVGTDRLGAPIIAHGIHNTLVVSLTTFAL
jgi:membrane protease YdiL (CAAX protease family)